MKVVWMLEYVLLHLHVFGGYHPDGVNLIVLGDSPAEIQARSRCHVRTGINIGFPVFPAGRQVRNEGAEWQAQHLESVGSMWMCCWW